MTAEPVVGDDGTVVVEVAGKVFDGGVVRGVATATVVDVPDSTVVVVGDITVTL